MTSTVPSRWAHLTLSSVLAPFARRVRSGPGAEHLLARLPGRRSGRIVDTTSAHSLAKARALGGVPMEVGGARAIQRDATTCGSAVLVTLAALGDPHLERWIADGTQPPGPLPEVPGVAGVAALARDGLHLSGPEHRFDAAQRLVKQATSRGALAGVDWPDRLGTPPWSAARTARFPGVRYRPTPFDDRSVGGAHVLAAVHSAARAGVPVPLYVSGDLSPGLRHGLSRAVPRHVVLVLPVGAGLPGYVDGEPVVTVYEPSRGLRHLVPLVDLLARSEPHRALGGWSRVVWALLPEPVGRHLR